VPLCGKFLVKVETQGNPQPPRRICSGSSERTRKENRRQYTSTCDSFKVNSFHWGTRGKKTERDPLRLPTLPYGVFEYSRHHPRTQVRRLLTVNSTRELGQLRGGTLGQCVRLSGGYRTRGRVMLSLSLRELLDAILGPFLRMTD